MKKHWPNVCMGLVANSMLAAWIVWRWGLNTYTFFLLLRLALWDGIGILLGLLVATTGKRWALKMTAIVVVAAFCYGLGFGNGVSVARVGAWFAPGSGAVAVAWVVSGTAGLLIDGERKRLFWQSATWVLLLVLAFASELGFALWRIHENS